MKNTKLLQLLKTFSVSEINEFGKFIRSPFYNESEKMIKLYDFIRKYYPEFNDKAFTKEKVYKELYGTSKYDDKKVRDRCSDMLKLAEEYLAIMRIKSEKFIIKKFTLDELLDRKLEIHFEKKYKEAQKILQENKFTDDDGSFLNQYLLAEMYNRFYQYKHPIGKKNNFFDGMVVELEFLFKYFSTLMMRYYAFANHVKGFINVNFDYDFYDEVMNYFSKKNLKQYPLINSLWCILKIHETKREDESLYEELKKLYLDNYTLFEEKDRIMIITELYNFTWIKSMVPGTKYPMERFEIIKLQIEHDAYAKQEGWMQREQYTTVIKSAAEVKEFEWIEKFIETYTIKVVPELRENSYHWAKAFLYYSQKKHEPALIELSKTKNGDYIFYINIKTLLMKILFELNEYEKVLSTIDTFKHFINSGKFIPDYIKERNLNFLNFSNKIALLYMDLEIDEFKTVKLTNEINNFSSKELVNQSWLIEKINEYKINKKAVPI